MLKEFREFQENVELAKAFDLDLDLNTLQTIESLMELEYDDQLKGFWNKALFQACRSSLEKVDTLVLNLYKKFPVLGLGLSYEDIEVNSGINELDFVSREALFLTVLDFLMDQLRARVGKIGNAISDEVFSEIKSVFGFELSSEMELKRKALLLDAEKINLYDGLKDSKTLEVCMEMFPLESEAADVFSRIFWIEVIKGDLLVSYVDLFNLMVVDSDVIKAEMDYVNTAINKLIEDFDGDSDSENSNEVESIDKKGERLIRDKLDNGEVIDAEFLTPEELYEKVSSEEFTFYKNDLDTFLKNPNYISSLLRLFGSFKVTTERENENRDDVFEITKLFLQKCISYAHSKGWSLEASIIFKETLKSQFRSYGFVLDVVEFIESLSFEEEYEDEEEYDFYHPKSIRFVNNERIDVKDFRKVVKNMGGQIDGNGHSRHAQYIIPFTDFDFVYALPTNYFKGKHSRFARITINELADFLNINGIDGISKVDFDNLREAYASIGITVEYRP